MRNSLISFLRVGNVRKMHIYDFVALSKDKRNCFFLVSVLMCHFVTYTSYECAFSKQTYTNNTKESIPIHKHVQYNTITLTYAHKRKKQKKQKLIPVDSFAWLGIILCKKIKCDFDVDMIIWSCACPWCIFDLKKFIHVSFWKNTKKRYACIL